MQAWAKRPTVFLIGAVGSGGAPEEPWLREIAFGFLCHFVARSGLGHQHSAVGTNGCLLCD